MPSETIRHNNNGYALRPASTAISVLVNCFAVFDPLLLVLGIHRFMAPQCHQGVAGSIFMADPFLFPEARAVGGKAKDKADHADDRLTSTIDV